MTRDSSKQDQEVFIKWTAYLDMMKHVLRFGSNAIPKNSCRECMGLLIGHLSGTANDKGIQRVIIEVAVPVSHGGSIEVAFRPQDYVAFSELEEQYLERGWFTVGWYHSHPGLTCFFSSTDIINQLGWQTNNPSAIGIVWDHQRLFKKGDMGFEMYRLDNPALGPASGYHKVSFTVETPNNIDYYSKFAEIITRYQSTLPPIFEINEVPTIFKEIQFPKIHLRLPQKFEDEMGELFNQFRSLSAEEFESAIALFIHKLTTDLNDYSQSIASVYQFLLIKLQSLFISLNQAVGRIQHWYTNSIQEFLQSLDGKLKNMLSFNDEQKLEVQGNLNDIIINIEDNLNKAFDREIKKSLNEIAQRIAIIVDKYMKIGETSRIAASEIAIQKQDTDDIFNLFKQKIVQVKSNGVKTVAETGNNLNNEMNEVSERLFGIERQIEVINKRIGTISKNLKKWRRKL
ncbi:MAG: Mov34/MPN/PAD-1 family protein [Candidatus Lokiarchaeota archaeon]|nr:Mov34/MPN/PAD-1 family protein [Candidatus Lokiarchaeota archaeon]